ncbi:MAG: hypothetical protein WC979_02995 [Candidatus Pacearchaeota archaeon]|jgi:hypothetical protein|nr:hypothetical protein [Clostridia bacterium]
MEKKYCISVEQRPDESFKRYYPMYWGGYFNGVKVVEQWRRMRDDGMYYTDISDAYTLINRWKEQDKIAAGGYEIEKIMC